MAPPTTRSHRNILQGIHESNILPEDRIQDLKTLNRKLIQDYENLQESLRKAENDRKYFEEQLYECRRSFWHTQDELKVSQKNNQTLRSENERLRARHDQDSQNLSQCQLQSTALRTASERARDEVYNLRIELQQYKSGIWVFGRRVYSGGSPREIKQETTLDTLRDPMVW